MADAMIMIAGQSNALGFLNNGAAPYVPTARVQIWTDTNGDGVGDAFNYLRPGVNAGTLANPMAWGGEVQFANDWLADNPAGTLWIGKTVKGATGLAQDDNAQDWSPQSRGELFDSATRTAHDMQANIAWHGDPLAVLWMQGETDATDHAKAGAYANNLRDLIAHMRANWGASEITMGRITDTAGDPADNLTVRQAQWLVDQEDPDVVSFKTIGFDMQPDGLHYAPAGQLALGAAFYDGWMV